MSTSRFIIFGTMLFSRGKTVSRTHKTLSQIPTTSNRPFLSFPLNSQRRFSSSVALDSVPQQQQHPWPEWVRFVDQLKNKGYFTEAASEGEAEGAVYKDMTLLKEACLSFARDRYDVFRSLCREDIKKVTEIGCPNLLRKAVNSSKRLRAYVHLDEGDVCGGCNLRGSCDRAYVILKFSEGDARMVDLLRILLYHALDPLAISDEERPASKVAVETAVRKLLSELIELSDTPPDPSLPKPSTRPLHQIEQKANLNIEKLYQDVEMKRGDWMCPKCDFMNFARNMRCLNCNEEGPKSIGSNKLEMKKGDWTCSECNFMNFARNRRCLQCKAEGPERVNINAVEVKNGDWICSKCHFMNFARNKMCLRCQEPRPKRHLSFGEWECPSCDFLNYRRNAVCLKCNHECPKDAVRDGEEHIWQSPC